METREALHLLALGCGLVACAAATSSCSSGKDPSGVLGEVADGGGVDAPDGGGVDATDGGTVTSFYGTDCPAPRPSTVPAKAPRILVLGPDAIDGGPDPNEIAAHLQGMLGGNSAFESVVAVGQTIEVTAPPDGSRLDDTKSLMSFFYSPFDRAHRLAQLGTPWSHVVIVEDVHFATKYPELYFEGVRVLACAARAVGAKPIVLMTARSDSLDTDARGEIAYRIANGTGSVLSPAGYAWAALNPPSIGAMAPPATPAATYGGMSDFVAAASLYSTLTGRNAFDTGYVPSAMDAKDAAQQAAVVLETVTAETSKVHYENPYSGVVQMQTMAPGSDFWFLDWGTSSEALWQNAMISILPKAGLHPRFQETSPAAPEGQPWCDATACVTALTPYLEKQQFALVYARDYFVNASTLQGVGPQSQLQVQIWDRHRDGTPSDGTGEIADLDYVIDGEGFYNLARSGGFAFTPVHLMFAKLKTMRPSVQLLRDGTHATDTVVYGQAVMSIVSRTSIHVPTTGLDSDTALGSELADETIRQLSSLSASGVFIPDDPSTRPR